MAKPTSAPLAVRIDEAANMLGIGRTKLYQLVGDGHIATIKIGRRRLVRYDELARFVDRAELPIEAEVET